MNKRLEGLAGVAIVGVMGAAASQLPGLAEYGAVDSLSTVVYPDLPVGEANCNAAKDYLRKHNPEDAPLYLSYLSRALAEINLKYFCDKS